MPKSVSDRTYVNAVHTSLGGDALRIVLTNEFGTQPLIVGATSIVTAEGGRTVPARFGGRAEVTIPAGAYVVSDSIAMVLPHRADVRVALYLPQQRVAVPTCHEIAVSTTSTYRGNRTSDLATGSRSDFAMKSWCFLKAVQVRADKDSGAIVGLGDSITDGARSTRDANRRWPDVLAARLSSAGMGSRLSVLNEGMGGNRLLLDDAGPSALARLDRDVLAQPGARYLVLIEGINDIGRYAKSRDPRDRVTAEQLEFAITQIVTRAHARGLKVYLGTLTPFGGARNASAEGMRTRDELNQWIRKSHVAEGVIDFDRALRDPREPQRLLPLYDSGDKLHPNDAGYRAMGDAVDLALFR